jgi:phosphomethylpyrimidine synthase
LCKEAPFYVLGPLVTDIAAGYDHIAGAIGGAIAAASGADFLCYVTPSEHLSLPDVEDVKQGVISARIAAHAADIVKGVAGAAEWDRKMSLARHSLDWQEQARLSLDPQKAHQMRARFSPTQATCSMCGPFCAMALTEKYLKISTIRC